MDFLKLSREKSRPGRRRRRRRKKPERRRLVGSGSSGYGGGKARRKEVVEISEVPRAEFLIPESYEAEPDCAPAGAISGFTFVNFVLSAASVAANLVNNANANANNNNNNNKWVE